MNDEINKRYFDLRPVELSYQLHTVWTSGEHAGERRTHDLSTRQTAVQTMNALLEHGVCAWITEVQDESR
jgi:hypothetical protein